MSEEDWSTGWSTFTCDGCGRKGISPFDEFIVKGEGRSLCCECVDKVLDAERVFLDHIPGCVDSEHHLTLYSTWEDLERKLRKDYPFFMAGHRIGCSDVTEKTAMLLEVFESDGEVQWWVLGTAYNIPGKPPWPHWKEIVRELGGRI